MSAQVAARPRRLRLEVGDAVQRIAHCAAAATSEDDLLNNIALQACSITGADACDILLRESGDGLVLRACTNAPEFHNRVKLGKGIGLSGKALASKKAIFLRRQAEKHRDFARYPGIDDIYSEAMAVTPLVLEKRAIGVLLLRKGAPWLFKDSEKTVIYKIAEAAANAYVAYRKGFETGSQASRISALSEVSKTISTSPYMDEILQLLVSITAQQFDYRVCTVRLLDEEHGELVLRATQAPARAYARKRAIKLGESIAGRAIAENKPVIVPDVQQEAEYIGHDLAVEQGLRSMVCMPLTLFGRVVGVMSCYTSEVREFPPDEIKALETLAKQAAISIEHAKLQVRNTLMQEMHHRVKNNLQQIASLLRLQIRQTHYKSLEEALNDTLARILAIASVHDLLSREDLDHVGLKTMADMLVQTQKNSLILPDRRISFDVRGQDVRVSLNQATQVALILNELIQNAVEHGFHHALEGEIHINVEENNAEVSIWVSNNGDRLPEGFEMSKSSNLGLQIVDSLTRGLGGKFKIGDIWGWTVAEVKFARAGGE